MPSREHGTLAALGLDRRAGGHARVGRRIRGHGYVKGLGPGIVTGAADDDPSGIGTYSQVGAAYGYGLVWSIPAVAPFAAAVQETAARLGLVTGCGLATLIRARFPRVVLYAALLLVLAANTFNIAADVAATAASTRLVIDLHQAPLLVAYVALMMTLEITLPYHRYARVLRWLALSLLAYVFVLASVHVDWGAVADGLLTPNVVGGAGGIAALIAVFGTT